jgi:hypothetical protein
MANNFEKLIFGGLHEKHADQRGIWVPTQHSLWDQGKPRKTLIELASLQDSSSGPWQVATRTALWSRKIIHFT